MSRSRGSTPGGRSGKQVRPADRDRYGAPKVRRTALAPGLIAVMALLIGFALIGSGGFVVIEFIVAILALIVAWFAFQAGQWWWIPLLLAIAVAWNPVVPFDFHGALWFGAQYVAILVFVLVAVFVRVPVADEQKPGRVG
ncbi:DUF6804 family protein [Lysinimonas soli]|uniref:DUF6804 family protein n=1 Tax=Lysinimonas soli TaxID=1074233 RepID=A0ABW0NPT4_9MICO